jgi:hypothetical protein
MSADIVATLSLAAAIGSGSFMISKSKMFAFLRDRTGRRKQKGLPWAWLSGVLICPYCTGTWLSLAAVAVYHPRLVHEWAPLDYLVMVMVINGLAMLPVLIIMQAVGMRDGDHRSPQAGNGNVTDGLLATSGASRSSGSPVHLSGNQERAPGALFAPGLGGLYGGLQGEADVAGSGPAIRPGARPHTAR